MNDEKLPAQAASILRLFFIGTKDRSDLGCKELARDKRTCIEALEKPECDCLRANMIRADMIRDLADALRPFF